MRRKRWRAAAFQALCALVALAPCAAGSGLRVYSENAATEVGVAVQAAELDCRLTADVTANTTWEEDARCSDIVPQRLLLTNEGSKLGGMMLPWRVASVEVSDGADWSKWWCAPCGNVSAVVEGPTSDLDFRKVAIYTPLQPVNKNTLRVMLNITRVTNAPVSIVFESNPGGGSGGLSCYVRVERRTLPRPPQPWTVITSAPYCPFGADAVTSVRVECHSNSDALGLGGTMEMLGVSGAWTTLELTEPNTADTRGSVAVQDGAPALYAVGKPTEDDKGETDFVVLLHSTTMGALTATAGVATFLTGGASAAMVGRVGILRHASFCRDTGVYPYFWSVVWEVSPLGFGIGPSPEEHLIGAALGNLATLVAIALLLSIATGRASRSTRALIGFPGCMFALVHFLLHGTTFSAGRLIYYTVESNSGSSLGYVVGVGALLVCLTCPVVIHFKVIRRVKRHAYLADDARISPSTHTSPMARSSPSCSPNSSSAPFSPRMSRAVSLVPHAAPLEGWQRVWWMWAFGSGLWLSLDEDFCERRGKVFERFAPKAYYYYVCADIVLTLLLALSTGLCPPTGSTNLLTRDVVITVLLTVQLLLLLIVRPYLAHMDNLITAIMAGLLAASALLTCLYNQSADSPGSGEDIGSARLLFFTAILALLKGVWDLVTFCVDLKAQRMEWENQYTKKLNLKQNKLFDFDVAVGHGDAGQKSKKSSRGSTSAGINRVVSMSHCPPDTDRKDPAAGREAFQELTNFRFASESEAEVVSTEDGSDDASGLLSTVTSHPVNERPPRRARTGIRSTATPTTAASASRGPPFVRSSTFRKPNPYRVRLVAFFGHHDRDRLKDVDALLDRHQGNESALFDSLVRQYGEEPKLDPPLDTLPVAAPALVTSPSTATLEPDYALRRVLSGRLGAVPKTRSIMRSRGAVGLKESQSLSSVHTALPKALVTKENGIDSPSNPLTRRNAARKRAQAMVHIPTSKASTSPPSASPFGSARTPHSLRHAKTMSRSALKYAAGEGGAEGMRARIVAPSPRRDRTAVLARYRSMDSDQKGAAGGDLAVVLPEVDIFEVLSDGEGPESAPLRMKSVLSDDQTDSALSPQAPFSKRSISPPQPTSVARALSGRALSGR